MAKKPYQPKDALHQRAQQEGFRSRAAYKLQELDKRFSIFRGAKSLLDLGAWPGGWLQVAAAALGPQACVVGLDRTPIDPLPQTDVKHSRIQLFIADVFNDREIKDVFSQAGDRYDIVLSDMAPKLSGIVELDRSQCQALAERALQIASGCLNTGGKLVVKVFKSPESEQFVKSVRPLFNSVKRVELDATRSTSNEFYVVALGFKSSAN